VAIDFQSLQFPDQRTGNLWQLATWIPIGQQHDLRLSVDYALIESDAELRSGGGALALQWTGLWLRRGWVRLATDGSFRAPNGDGALHPLSAKAPSLQARIRLGLVGDEERGVWLGWFGQRVSPPAESELADAYFPSGSGLDIAGSARWKRVTAQLQARHALAGLRSADWLQTELGFDLSDELSLQLGALVSPGPKRERLCESGWTLGFSWRPAPAAVAPAGKAAELEPAPAASLSSKPVPAASR
jgi:hypothetical protein